MFCFSWLRWNCKDSTVMRQTVQGGKKYLHLIYTQQTLLVWCIFACISVCSCFESNLLLFFCIQLSKLIRHELAWTSLSTWDCAEMRNYLFWHKRCCKCTKFCLLFCAHCILQALSDHLSDSSMAWVLSFMVHDFALNK